MLKTISIFFAAAGIATPALAETLVHDGITYSYSVEQRGGVQLISGEDVTTHRPFKLRVSKDRVEGVVDGSPVSFLIRDVVHIKSAEASAEVATR